MRKWEQGSFIENVCQFRNYIEIIKKVNKTEKKNLYKDNMNYTTTIKFLRIKKSKEWYQKMFI